MIITAVQCERTIDPICLLEIRAPLTIHTSKRATYSSYQVIAKKKVTYVYVVYNDIEKLLNCAPRKKIKN